MIGIVLKRKKYSLFLVPHDEISTPKLLDLSEKLSNFRRFNLSSFGVFFLGFVSLFTCLSKRSLTNRDSHTCKLNRSTCWLCGNAPRDKSQLLCNCNSENVNVTLRRHQTHLYSNFDVFATRHGAISGGWNLQTALHHILAVNRQPGSCSRNSYSLRNVML